MLTMEGFTVKDIFKKPGGGLLPNLLIIDHHYRELFSIQLVYKYSIFLALVIYAENCGWESLRYSTILFLDHNYITHLPSIFYAIKGEWSPSRCY